MSEQQMLSWPASFPCPQRSGYSYEPTDTRARSEMEIGGRYRVLYDTDETVVTCSFVLRLDKLAFFEAFERILLAQGSIWFKMPLLTAGEITEHVVRLRERPKISNFIGKGNPCGYATVSLSLDLRERNTYSEAAAWLIYNDMYEAAGRLRAVLHTAPPPSQVDADMWLWLKLGYHTDAFINGLAEAVGEFASLTDTDSTSSGNVSRSPLLSPSLSPAGKSWRAEAVGELASLASAVGEPVSRSGRCSPQGVQMPTAGVTRNAGAIPAVAIRKPGEPGSGSRSDEDSKGLLDVSPGDAAVASRKARGLANGKRTDSDSNTASRQAAGFPAVAIPKPAGAGKG